MANLFIIPTRLGDAILTTGAVNLFRDEPAVIIASSLAAPLFEDFPHLEKIITIAKQPWKKHWVDVWRQIRGQKWNTVVDMKGSFLAYGIKAQKRFVWKQRHSRDHKVLQISHCMKAATPLAPTLWLSENRFKANQFERPTLAVAPAAGWIGKQWPMQQFARLLVDFCQQNSDAQVALFAAPSEKAQLLPLFEALPAHQYVDTIGKSLLDVAALLKSSRLFIGNDSGLMHMSVAVQTPTIALFGPSNDRIYGPWSMQIPSPHHVIRSMPYPKKKIIQTPTDTYGYMDSLPLETVQNVLNARWKEVNEK